MKGIKQINKEFDNKFGTEKDISKLDHLFPVTFGKRGAMSFIAIYAKEIKQFYSEEMNEMIEYLRLKENEDFLSKDSNGYNKAVNDLNGKIRCLLYDNKK